MQKLRKQQECSGKALGPSAAFAPGPRRPPRSPGPLGPGALRPRAPASRGGLTLELLHGPQVAPQPGVGGVGVWGGRTPTPPEAFSPPS